MFNFDENSLIDFIAQKRTKGLIVPNALVQKYISKKLMSAGIAPPQFIMYGHLAAQLPLLKQWLGEVQPISAVFLDPVHQKLEALKIVLSNDIPLKMLPVVFGGQSQALISERSDNIKVQLFNMDPNVIALRAIQSAWQGCNDGEVLAFSPYGNGEYAKLCRSVVAELRGVTIVGMRELEEDCQPNDPSLVTEALDVQLEAISIVNLASELLKQNKHFAIVINSNKLRSHLKCILSNIDISTNESIRFSDLREYSEFMDIAQLLVLPDDKNSWLDLLFEKRCAFSLSKLQFNIFSKSLNQVSMLKFVKEFESLSQDLSRFLQILEDSMHEKSLARLLNVHIKLFEVAFGMDERSSGVLAKLSSFLEQCELHARNLDIKLKSRDQYIDALSFLFSSIDLRAEKQSEAVSILTLEQLDYLNFDSLIISDDDLFHFEKEDEIEASNLTQARLNRVINSMECFLFRAAQDRESKALNASKYISVNYLLRGAVRKINYANYSKFGVPSVNTSLPKLQFDQPTLLTKYSVSALEKLVRCPYVFALEYILNIRKRDLFFEYNFNKDHGQNLHQLLAQLDFTKSSGEIYRNVERLCVGINDTLEGVYREYLTHTFKQTVNFLIESLGWSDLISDSAEQKLEKEILSGQTKLFAIIDRLLQTTEGALLVDFKTGSIPTKREIEQGLFPQLVVEKYLIQDLYNNPSSAYIRAAGANSDITSHDVDEAEYIQHIENLIMHFSQSGAYFTDATRLDDLRLRDFYHVLRFTEN